jgi:hypothetical protein
MVAAKPRLAANGRRVARGDAEVKVTITELNEGVMRNAAHVDEILSEPAIACPDHGCAARELDHFKMLAKEYQQKGDWENALFAFRTAAELGDAEAQFAVGNYLENGVGTRTRLKEAVKWYEKAVASSVDALYSLARCYFEGRGVTRDREKGVKLFRKAAKQGDPFAQYSLGLAYVQGRGVACDFNKGFTWLLKAAHQDFAPAQFSVGLSYSRGQGVRRDLAAAEKWYARAAEQGDADARRNLEWLRSRKRAAG